MILFLSISYGLLVGLVILQSVWYYQQTCEIKCLKKVQKNFEDEIKEMNLELREKSIQVFKFGEFKAKIAKFAGELAKIAQEETRS